MFGDKKGTYINWKHVSGVQRSFWFRFVWPVYGRMHFFIFKRYWRTPLRYVGDRLAAFVLRRYWLIPFWPPRKHAILPPVEHPPFVGNWGKGELLTSETSLAPFYKGGPVVDNTQIDTWK